MGFSKAAKEAFEAALDMARDARMARAKEMGFDTEKTWYHGRTNKGDAFDGDAERRPFFTTSKERAAGYGDGEPEAFYLRMENPARANEFSAMYHDAAYTQDGRQWLKDDGHDGVIDAGNPWDMGLRAGGDTATPFDPSNIRSTNAAFDPAKKNSSNLLASVAGAGVLTGAMLPSEEAEASFIGPLARTFNRAALDVAQQLEKRGATREEIWRETGQLGSPTFKDVDGHWKQEIDDRGFQERPNFDDATDDFSLTSSNPDLWVDWRDEAADRERGLGIGRGYELGPLKDAYPELQSIRLQPTESNAFNGSYAPEDKTMTVASPDALMRMPEDRWAEFDSRSVPLHELQHAIQAREGFATGGSPEQFTLDSARYRYLVGQGDQILAQAKHKAGRLASDPQSELLSKARQHFEKLGDGSLELHAQGVISDEDLATDYLLDIHPEYNEIYKELQTNKQLAARPMDTYKRLAGEAEARNVQTRMNMDMGQRIEKPPWQTLDVPEDKLIVRGNKAPALATLATTGALSLPTTAQEAVQATGPDRGTIANQLLALSQQGDANPDTVQNLNGSPLLVQLANGLESNTQSPLGESHVQGIVDLLRKWGYREQASPLDYGMAALDVAP